MDAKLPEEQYILRFPPEVAKQVRKQLKNNQVEKMSMQFGGENSVNKVGTLQFGEETYKVTLADLPTLVETHKSMDFKSYYKSGDIGQILVVTDTAAPYNLSKIDNSNAVIDGLTPAAKNIKKRKFRKIPIVSPEEIKEAQDEIVKLQRGGIFREFEVELIPVEDIDEIYDTPNQNTIITLKNGPPIRAGVPSTFTDSELELLPQKHKDLARAEEMKRERELEAEMQQDALDLSVDDDLPDEGEPGSEPPTKKRRIESKKKKTQKELAEEEEAKRQIAEAETEAPTMDAGAIRALRTKKVDIANEIENDAANPVMKARLQEKINRSTEAIRVKKLEMAEVDKELIKYNSL